MAFSNTPKPSDTLDTETDSGVPETDDEECTDSTDDGVCTWCRHGIYEPVYTNPRLKICDICGDQITVELEDDWY